MTAVKYSSATPRRRLLNSLATPILGRLGDMFGKEHVLVGVLIMFALGSLVAALSHSIGLLIAGRAIQGFAGAVFPLAFAAVPALVIAFLGQRNDMALWLASFIVLGIVIMGAHALIAQNEGLLTLRDSMPMALTSMPVALTACVDVWSDSQPNGSPTISALNRIHSASA